MRGVIGDSRRLCELSSAGSIVRAYGNAGHTGNLSTPAISVWRVGGDFTDDAIDVLPGQCAQWQAVCGASYPLEECLEATASGGSSHLYIRYAVLIWAAAVTYTRHCRLFRYGLQRGLGSWVPMQCIETNAAVAGNTKSNQR